MFLNALVGCALAIVLLSVVDEGRNFRKSKKQRALWSLVWRGMRPRHLLAAPLVLGASAVVGYLLNKYVGGVFNWGWWSAIGGSGNVILGKNEQLFGVTGSQWIGRVMLVVIAVLMPNLVTWEERLFRRGIERRTSLGRVAWAIAFGLFHLVAGLPLFAALALSVVGYYCSKRYMTTYRALEPSKGAAVARRAAVLESTRAHLGFNTLGLIVAALTLVH